MDNLASDFFNILRYLLPGFLAAWVFHGLCAYEKATQFERVVQALIFTLVVQFVVSMAFIIYGTVPGVSSPFKPNIYVENVVSFTSAIMVGGLFAYFSNSDHIHKLLRRLSITEQTSYPSEWFGVFRANKMYVVLHLTDERRIMGWPKEWPQSSARGHFFIVQPSWLLENGQEEYLGDNGVEGILIAVSDVKWVEFLRGKENGKTRNKSAA